MSDLPAPLIDVDGVPPPRWAAVDEQVVSASAWQTIKALPTGAGMVIALAWRSSPLLTLFTGILHVVTGGITGLGLFIATTVFTTLLAGGPTPERVVAALPALASLVGAYSLRALLEAAAGAMVSTLAPRVRYAAQDDVNAAVTAADLDAFDDADFRELVRQGGQQGVSSIEKSVSGIADILSPLMSVTAAIVTAGFLNPWLAPALLLATCADAWAAMRTAKMRHESFLRTVSRQLRLWVVENLITGREVAVERYALNLRERLLAEHRRIAGSVMREAIRVGRRQSGVRLLGRTLAGVGTAIAYVVLGILLHAAVVPLAIAGSAVVVMRTASTALSNAVNAVNRLYEDTFYLTFYRALLTQARAKRRVTSGIEAPADPEVIALEDVSFSYVGADQPALRDITVTVRRGEVVALVGENGCGKTTLAKVITGLYQPTKGVVRWDDVDVSTADQHSVHARIAVISQDTARWPMTARDNIRIGRLDVEDPHRSRWARALRGSGADDVIESLPRGEDTVLSPQFRGSQDLSGGQWQRIGVARGIYRDAAILVADEPTAALDARAEAEVFDTLRLASRSTTTILVTHRLANVRFADRILVLKRGQVVEQGTHEALMAEGGLYRELYEIQARPFTDSPTTTS